MNIPAAATIPAPVAFQGHVLIVEDDRPLLEVYADMLMDVGFEVTVAFDGASALRALQSAQFDVVLSDVAMAGGDGVAVLRAVRERDLDVQVVLVTGSPSVETAVLALELGALHYLLKPVSAAELVRCVTHAARLRRLATVKRETLRYLGQSRALVADRAGLEAVYARAFGGLNMIYQPIVRVRDGSVFGWEALLRTSEDQISGPPEFLEVAERLGRTRELGRTIRAHVARTAKRTPGVMFFVNLHADDLLDDNLYDAHAPLSALAPEVVLEITERSPLEGTPDVRERVTRLRALGYRLAVDDLGSGYAGLTSLALVEPEFVKLDRGLIAGLDSDPVKRKVVGSIVSVSREMGISVVAEGIQTAGEKAAVSDMGCDLMQGFLFRGSEELRAAQGFEPAGVSWLQTGSSQPAR